MRRMQVAAAVLLLSSSAFAKDWDVRVRGRVVYDDGSGSKGLAGAHVRLMDSDTVIDDTMAQGWTDANGNFDVRGRGGDTWLPFGICDDNCSKPDPYVKIELVSDRVEVETELGFNWHANTPDRSNSVGDINLGTFTFASGDGQHAQVLFATTNKQYDFFTRTVGGRIPRHNGKINVLFPAVLAAGVPWTSEESIHWPGSYTGWSAVYHEFGHRIRHAADGDFLHFLGDVARFSYMQNHDYPKKTNEGFAFNEGWAEYHSTLLDPNETAAVSTWPRAGGDDIEGNVAGKLKRLSDSCGGFKNMWAVLSGGAQVHSYTEFERAMKQKFPACFAKPPPPPPAKAPILVARFTPLTLNQQAAVRANLVKVAVAHPVVPHVKAWAKPTHKVAPALQPQHKTLLKLTQLRSTAHTSYHSATLKAFEKHLGKLQPITPELAKNKQYLTQRQAARHGFVQDAFGAQVREIEKVKAEVKKQRSAASSQPLHKYFDHLIAKYDARTAELKKTLALKPAPDLKIPAHLLPRGLGAAVAAR